MTHAFSKRSVCLCVCAREMFFKFDFFKSMCTFSCTSQVFRCYRPCVLVLVHVRLGVCLHVHICDKRPVCMLVLSVQTYLWQSASQSAPSGQQHELHTTNRPHPTAISLPLSPTPTQTWENIKTRKYKFLFSSKKVFRLIFCLSIFASRRESLVPLEGHVLHGGGGYSDPWVSDRAAPRGTV